MGRASDGETEGPFFFFVVVERNRAADVVGGGFEGLGTLLVCVLVLEFVEQRPASGVWDGGIWHRRRAGGLEVVFLFFPVCDFFCFFFGDGSLRPAVSE